jgi:antitoxin YefM
MRTVSYTHARNNLAAEMERVSEDCDVTIITREKHESVVLVSMSEYQSWSETEHLLASPKNASRIREAIEQLDDGRGIQQDLFPDA